VGNESYIKVESKSTKVKSKSAKVESKSIRVERKGLAHRINHPASPAFQQIEVHFSSDCSLHIQQSIKKEAHPTKAPLINIT
jgi:hypothetical protein